MSIQGFRCKALQRFFDNRDTGDRKGVWSVRVSARLRLTFCYDGRDTYDIDLSHHYGD